MHLPFLAATLRTHGLNSIELSLKPSSQGMASRAKRALREAFRRAHPTVQVNSAGYVDDIAENLLAHVRLEDFETDLSTGAGGELGEKFRAIHSSSALAVNVFGPFRRRIADLVLPGFGRFSQLQFERRCPTGLRGTVPYLDVLLQGAQDVVGIESKLTEPLAKRRASFQPSYRENIRDGRRESAWFAEMLRLEQESGRFCWLDVAQLAKHAFGLARAFPRGAVTLLYLYGEPSNADRIPTPLDHRRELAAFSERVAGSHPRFRSISYPELWDAWSQLVSLDWLAIHLDDLNARYGVAL